MPSKTGSKTPGKKKNTNLIFILFFIFIFCRYDSFIKKVKYVIFDEVHCVGSAGGELWEQLLILIPCPFLALSATLGNPEHFKGWLERLEEARDRRLVCIEHKERYNDLAYFLFNPNDTANAETAGLVNINALATVTLPQYSGNGDDVSATATTSTTEGDNGNTTVLIPDDIRLLPEQCIELFDGLKKLTPELVSHLEPSVFFARINGDYAFNVSMRDVRAYEKELKSTVARGMNDPKYQVALRQLPINVSSWLETNKLTRKLDKDLAEENEFEYLENNLLGLLDSLRTKEWLPAIAFHWSSVGCEKLAIRLVKQIKKRIQAQMEVPSFKDRIAAVTKELNECKHKLERLGTFESVRNGTEEEDLKEVERDLLERYKNAERIIEQMHQKIHSEIAYIMPRQPFPSDSLLGDDRHLRYRYKAENPLHEMLKYGIAVYHAGLSQFYRRTVQRMFRMGHLAFIISTATLSLGVNMPCKTVIMAGDAPYLNGLNFRQMAGRAGRRGFDLRGNVAFVGVAPSKVMRLLRSELPTLRSNVPMSSTVVLRLIAKLARTTDAGERKQIGEGIKRLLNHSPFAPGPAGQVSTNGDELALQLSLSLRLTLDLLRESHVLDANGIPTDLAIMASQMNNNAPGNFAMIELLAQGHLDQVIAVGKANKKAGQDDDGALLLEALVNVLAHFVQTTPLHSFWSKPTFAKNIDTLLPAMPAGTAAAAKMAEYSDHLLKVAIAYWRCYVKAYKTPVLGADDHLPLSGQQSWQQASSSKVDVKFFQEAALPVLVRSAFVAISGKSDTFASVAELCVSQRRGLHIDPSLMPVFEAPAMQNAYLLDFFRKPSVETMQLGDHIRPQDIFDGEDIYRFLENFKFTLKLFKSTLEQRATFLSKNGLTISGELIDAVQALFKAFDTKFSQALES